MNSAGITLTDAAARRVRALLERQIDQVAGLRISVTSRGCSGLSYALDYAQERRPLDEVVEEKGVTLLIDPAAVMFMIGTEIDFVEDKLQSGFVFRNPNEKGRCGCGESFHV